ncbi:unnamed protein product [Spirodela intermedia]|uniref:Uncharacterized protein n=1 Tax=Spirodela intermedia TaxID=51605 RepID=A0A7I8IDH7_SPIIN|nr:unnamed protein product [Spirodela intermedia]CAA6655092.1 unnamed protein product [Spirodela intermedia]
MFLLCFYHHIDTFEKLYYMVEIPYLLKIKYFSTYEQINGRNVLIRNDVFCKTIGTLEANGCKYSIEVVSTACHLLNKSPTFIINFKALKKHGQEQLRKFSEWRSIKSK